MSQVKPRGGKRPGAGRKRKSVKFAGPIDAAETKIADALPGLVDGMLKLAAGGQKIVEEKHELRPVEKLEPITRSDGSQGTKKKTVFEMTLVEKRVSKTQPDRAAAQYLIDRLMGRPTQPHEFAKMSDEELIKAATDLFGGAEPEGSEAASSAEGE